MAELNPATRWECTGEEYHADPALGQSSLKEFMSDPELYRDKHVLGIFEEPQKDHFDYGTHLERLIFYGELPGVLVPEEVMQKRTSSKGVTYARTGKKYDAWLELQQQKHGPNVVPLRDQEWKDKVEPLLLARERLREDELASALLWGEGQVHVALKWTDELTGIECKCQLDVLAGTEEDPVAAVDFKTAYDVTERGFGRAVDNCGYYIQAYWYQLAVKRWLGVHVPFWFVCSRNQGARNCRVHSLDEAWYRIARDEVMAGMDRLAKARDMHEQGHLDAWLPEGHGRVTTISVPRWR